MGLARHFEELRIYREGFEAAMMIFELSRSWPNEEKFALTDQIRRSSRSICANIAESWRKRRYPLHFVSKLSDADSEAAETQNWLMFAHRCGYLNQAEYESLFAAYEKISGGIVKMMSNPQTWCAPSQNKS